MISNSAFIHSIEILKPNSFDYIKYWKEEKRRCIEGYWQSGKWMPPQLYFYVNHWTIEMNKKDSFGRIITGSKSFSRPDLRDLDWLRSYTLTEALGFSGFEDDTKYHCVREENREEFAWFIKDKEYVDARDYIKKNHVKNLGRATYYNNAKNVFDLEARGGGKTMWVSCISGHNYLFDGKTVYDTEVHKSQTLISGIKIDYVKNIATKIRKGLDSLQGGQTYLNKFYPSPFSKVETGTLTTDLYNTKVTQKDGIRKVIGSGSQINARTYGADVFAANGLRPKIAIIDEVGFMSNIKEVLSALVDCTYTGETKFGVVWMTGTGGEMEGKAVRDVQDVFYNPETWDFLSYNDDYENKGNIGLFIPSYYTLNGYKDDEGVTDVVKAKAFAEKQLQKAVDSKDNVKINSRMMNHPLVPSHAFLSSEGNIYPINLLKEQLQSLPIECEGAIGNLRIKDSKVIFDVDLDAKEIDYPCKPNQDLTGNVIIYEQPQEEEGIIPAYKYIASTDPYNLDGQGASLGSTFIYKRSSLLDVLGDVIVAEYTGRPKTVKEHNENVRLLCLYYNATNLYENQVQNLKDHFEHKGSLNLLAHTPNTFKATVTQSRTYGLNRTTDIRLELELYSSNWLIENNPNGNLNYQNIKSKSLLKELIAYDGETNTDRAIAFQLVIAYSISLTRKQIEQKKQIIKSSLFNKKFFT